MKLPDNVRTAIEGRVGRIDRIDGVSGGSISAAGRLVARGQSYFLKLARGASQEFFAVEAAGLELLRSADSSLVVPGVVGLGSDGETEWLLIEWLDPRGTPDFSTRLGRGLAALHRHTASEWGWNRDGFIGTLPQSNRPRNDWFDFWWEERLLPQIVAAEHYFQSTIDKRELRAAVERALRPIEDEGPSLLHGDLWGGNVMATPGGPAIYDPACYYGHREVDLAMTELFGGFDAAFYEAYDKAWPRRHGREARRAAYQLYYLLVHVNLFGGSYAPRTRDTIRHLLAA